MIYGATLLLNINLPLIYCFIFGALISPTDPIAVNTILKTSRIPPKLATIISGESMFNDAVGLILFVTLVGIAKTSVKEFSVEAILNLFFTEVIGGIIIGLAAGFAGYRLIKTIKDYQTMFLISLAVVLGIAEIASRFHASIPLAAVVAGLVIGNNSFGKDHPGDIFLERIWQLMDNVLNTILFVMIGLQLVLLPFLSNYWIIGLISVIIILLARLISISLYAIFQLRKFNRTNLTILTWAGLRGGISIAMALSLRPTTYREIILSCCYFIVIFSVIVQGLTLNKVVDRVIGKEIIAEPNS
jgi:monovalent cation:H+ antiporter, CPA1 family